MNFNEIQDRIIGSKTEQEVINNLKIVYTYNNNLADYDRIYIIRKSLENAINRIRTIKGINNNIFYKNYDKIYRNLLKNKKEINKFENIDTIASEMLFSQKLLSLIKIDCICIIFSNKNFTQNDYRNSELKRCLF